MPRIRIEEPSAFSFHSTIPVRITDVNYGGHVGNDAILSIIHEARIQFLAAHDYTELSFEGAGLIMSDVAIEFRKEIFYGDRLDVYVQAYDFSRIGFDICYKMNVNRHGKQVVAVLAKTGMICYDYALKKITPLSASALKKLQ